MTLTVRVLDDASRTSLRLFSLAMVLMVFGIAACSDGSSQTREEGEGDGDSMSEGSGGASNAAGTGGEDGTGGVVEGGASKHDFLVIDNYENQLAYVSQSDPRTSWSVPIPPGSRDIALLEATVLISHGDGAGEYALDTQELVWSVSGFSSVQTAQRLPNENTLIGLSGADSTFHELDGSGQIVNTIVVGGVAELRLARTLPNGNLLFTGDQGGFKVFEADGTGAVVWSAPLTGKGYEAVRLSNGNTLATTGETSTAIELAPDGSIAATVGGTENFEAELLWFSGVEVLENGNVVVANWHGHGMEESTGPHLVEFTPQNDIVWQFSSPDFKTITNVLMVN